MAYLMPLSLDSDPFIMASFQRDQISPLWQQKLSIWQFLTRFI